MNPSSSSSSSGGSDVVLLRKPNTLEPPPDYFATLDDVDFLVWFRLSKNSTAYLLSLIEHQLVTPANQKHPLTPSTKLLLTLRFYGLGSIHLAVKDFRGIIISLAQEIVHQVSTAIAYLARVFIRMPSGDAEIQQAQQDFFKTAKMPRVIGAIICTHVKIYPPTKFTEVFRNRQGHFSLNVQTICSANMKILDIVARWPGSTRDPTIFCKSRIKQRLRAQEFGDSLIIGDSIYANTNYLITPFHRIKNPVEAIYNESLIQTRNSVKRQSELWKKRFPVLSLGISLNLTATMAVIVATGVLYNLALEKDDPLPLDHNDERLAVNDGGGDGTTAARDRLVKDHFARLV